MRIYLDPDKTGCAVWFSDGNIQHLKGDIRDICKAIKNFAFIVRYDCENRLIKHQKVEV